MKLILHQTHNTNTENETNSNIFEHNTLGLSLIECILIAERCSNKYKKLEPHLVVEFW
jgi:hypothetical protein